MDQARGEPSEWGGGAAGYGRRFGSRFGRNGIENTIQFGIAALDGEDYRYRPTNRKGVLPRVYGAAFQTLFPVTTRGHRTLAFSLLAGTFGSGLISNTWYPDRESSVGDGMLRGTTALAGDVGVSIFWEFWPDIKKEIKKKVLHRK